MQWLYVAFWVLVGSMLFWQFHTYNRKLDKAVADAGPRQEHFYFINAAQTNTTVANPNPTIKPDGADVKQVSFSFQNNVPNPGSITCHVALKNEGNMKATDIQIQVFPFRGALVGTEDDNNDPLHAIPDSDPAAQYNQWISFPDLEPGQTMTKDAVFLGRPGMTPADNARPKITFHTVKPQPVPASTP